MKIKQIASNMTEATVNNITLLYSYETPVAGYDDQGAFRTDEKFSRTTSKHINQYLGGADVGRVIPQVDIEGMVA
jgi:hypothetical protein